MIDGSHVPAPISVLISIATFRRPESLRRLLESIYRSEDAPRFHVLVVDNDPAESGKGVCSSFLNKQLKYVVENEAGIASARNRGLDELGDEDYIVFVDDDEYVEPNWLNELSRYASCRDADVVCGQVISEFPAGTPPWIIKGGFITRPARATGMRLNSAATNNTLLRVESWRSVGSPKFSTAFSSTGGSDSDLFSRLVDLGLRIEHCAGAVVTEPVERDRLTFKWISRRALRNGVVASRLSLQRHSVLAVLARDAWLATSGGALCIFDFVLAKGLQARSYNRFLNGVGGAMSIFGGRIHEYRRLQ